MIIFKLIMFLLIITFVVIVIRFIRRLWNKVDSVDIKEKKKKIKLKSDLVDEVSSFKKRNKKDIKNADSNVIDEFIES